MRVFVSYARHDAAYAQQLSKALRERGIEVTGDMALMAGTSWASALHRMMDDADGFALITSKSSSASSAIDQEIAFAATRAGRDRNIRLIPIVLDRHAELPPLLSRYQFIGPDDARDPARTAALIQESLDTSVPSPNLNLEREIFEAERSYLQRRLKEQDQAIAKWSSFLIRTTAAIGLLMGVVGTTLAVVLAWNTESNIANLVVIAVASAVSTSIAVLVNISSRRPRSDK
ncbi:toll/interleukin-1 receptor domain-containing protein [Nocardia sp. XZ_19_369]|uniref:toll/interleukin-1 receptor domain-containing protein n=1 Tax=Nocardia sp. XZ_19_369 TaxID=2769487 RepID=UPI00188EDC11|nr:toll/interleukin-1 receptor domain-containing protein [Nocardia sp. XZ_19_369]